MVAISATDIDDFLLAVFNGAKRGVISTSLYDGSIRIFDPIFMHDRRKARNHDEQRHD